MHLVRYHALDALAPLAEEWNGLTRGVPFRRWEWLCAWWLVYGLDRTDRELFVICVFDDNGHLVGVAPWYIQVTPVEGRVVHFLGNEEVCSDYLTVLCDERCEREVAHALAEWLSAPRPALGDWLSAPGSTWDTIHLDGVDAEDRFVVRLVQELSARGNHLHRAPGVNCWRLPLAATWDDWLASLSKNSRRLMRKAAHRLQTTPDLQVRVATATSDLPRALQVLTKLHQARWQRLGEKGCFASEAFATFHAAATRELFAAGATRLQWIELQGKPIAVDHFLLGRDVVYVYQGGMHPDFLHWEPGRLSIVAAIRRAIDEGFRAIDFLRGDEPYKAQYQAGPRPSMNHRIVAPQVAAQARHGAWLAGDWLKGMLKDLLRTPNQA